MKDPHQKILELSNRIQELELDVTLSHRGGNDYHYSDYALTLKTLELHLTSGKEICPELKDILDELDLMNYVDCRHSAEDLFFIFVAIDRFQQESIYRYLYSNLKDLAAPTDPKIRNRRKNKRLLRLSFLFAILGVGLIINGLWMGLTWLK